jgi:hypothetical protein
MEDRYCGFATYFGQHIVVSRQAGKKEFSGMF